ncbi:unnamed protein product [Phytophthora fragariaefolia]|uniref:Unnamed protein product n=1 Tax=Phytophthora fragariaefolia TaxID=1490495 RepID=A0A9W7CU11_9STRA|nr:unnamed protein product [Phytophthora fragariaefolia]
MLRWRLEIEEFGPELHYVKGENNVVADTLSRLPRADDSDVQQQETLVAVTAMDLTTPSNVNLREIARCQKRDGTATLKSAMTTEINGVELQVDSTTEHWSPHFMALSAQLDGESIYILNIYTPKGPLLREEYFSRLAKIQLPPGVQVYVGGDYNCTQNDLQDRSYAPTAQQHRSQPLEPPALLTQWGLHDSLEAVLPNTTDPSQLQWFHTQHHTHEYSVSGRGLASSRLDRWYVNGQARCRLADTQVDTDGLRSDHKGVAVLIRSPANPFTSRRRSLPSLTTQKNESMNW